MILPCKLMLLAILLSGWQVEAARRDHVSAMSAVIEKLSAVAEGKQASSGLRLADLKAAKSEWDRWPSNKKEQAKSVPMVRLVVDFVLTPMGFAHLQLDLEQPETFAFFLKRLEICFKKFLPAYEGEQLSSKIAIRVAKTLNLYDSLIAGRPVDMGLFKAAKRETDAWRSRLEELTSSEDIYANTQELEYLFNFFNLMSLKPLWMDVFPKMDSEPNLDAQQLVKIYFQALERRYNIKRNADGQLVRYVEG